MTNQKKKAEVPPLAGRRIVVTRTQQQSGSLSARLRELGADVLEIPAIRIEPPERADLIAFGQCVQDAHTYDWLIFTSANTVTAFFDLFFRLYKDIRAIGGARIAAIGAGTAARLRDYHLDIDLMPKRAVAESLADAFENEVGSLENLTMFWPRAEGARTVLSERLNAAGVILDEAIAYRTVPETGDPTGDVARFRKEGAELVTFTSASTVDGFLGLKLPWPEALRTASIGPVTSAALRERGFPVDIEANPHDLSGLVHAVCQLVGRG